MINGRQSLNYFGLDRFRLTKHDDNNCPLIINYMVVIVAFKMPYRLV